MDGPVSKWLEVAICVSVNCWDRIIMEPLNGGIINRGMVWAIHEQFVRNMGRNCE